MFDLSRLTKIPLTIERVAIGLRISKRMAFSLLSYEILFMIRSSCDSLLLDDSPIREVTSHDTKFKVLSRDLGLGKELALFHVHEPLVTSILAGVVKEGSVVMDIGANIGYYSAIFSDLLGSNGMVICIEPHPESSSLLKLNMEGRPNTTVLRCALGSSRSEGWLLTPERVLNLARLVHDVEDQRAGEYHRVSISTVDEIVERLKLPRLDLIRMDVEGSELDIISGGDLTLRRFRPRLCVEVHPKELGLRKTHSLLRQLSSLYQNTTLVFRIFDFLYVARKEAVKHFDSEAFLAYFLANQQLFKDTFTLVVQN